MPSTVTNIASSISQLVQMTPRLMSYLGDGKLTAHPTYANTYVINWAYVSKIYQVDTYGVLELTKVSGTPANYQYSVDANNNILLKVTRVPSNAASAIVLDFNIHVTGGFYRYLPNKQNINVEWVPIITRYPDIGQSLDNVTSGILSSTLSSLEIIRIPDIEYLFSDSNISWRKAELNVWLVTDNSPNGVLAFTGLIDGHSISTGVVRFKVRDYLASLNEKCQFNEGLSWNYFNLVDFPSMELNKIGSPIKLINGSVSRYEAIHAAIPSLPFAKIINPTSMPEAVCTGYSDTIATNTNRVWGLCKTINTIPAPTSTKPIPLLSVDNSNPDYTGVQLDPTGLERWMTAIGTSIIFQPSGVPRYARILASNGSGYVWLTKDPNIVMGLTAYISYVTVVITDGINTWYPIANRDYLHSSVGSVGGSSKPSMVSNRYASVTFKDNFEANHAGLAPLHSSTHRVHYRIQGQMTDYAGVIYQLLTAAGLRTNDSFNDITSEYHTVANLSIPSYSEGDFAAYWKYIQHLLKSTNTMLYMEPDASNVMKIGIKLIENDVTADYVADDANILERSWRKEFDHNDIVSGAIAYNDNFFTEDWMKASAETTLDFPWVRAFYKINNVNRIEHVVEKYNRVPYRTTPEVKFDISVPLDAVDVKIGDSISLHGENVKVVGKTISETIDMSLVKID